MLNVNRNMFKENKKALEESSRILYQRSEREKEQKENEEKLLIIAKENHEKNMYIIGRAKSKKDAFLWRSKTFYFPIIFLVLLPFALGALFMFIVAGYSVEGTFSLQDYFTVSLEKYSFAGLWSIGYYLLSFLLAAFLVKQYIKVFLLVIGKKT